MCVGVIINNQWKKSLKPRPLDSFKAAREPLLLPPIHLPSPTVLSSSGSQSIFFPQQPAGFYPPQLSK